MEKMMHPINLMKKKKEIKEISKTQRRMLIKTKWFPKVQTRVQ